MSNSLQMGTRAVWAGEEEYLMQGATQVPIVHSVSFGYRDMDEWLQVALGQKEGHIYSRNTNPTVQAFEEKIRNLEDADAVTSAATGMGIISSTLFALLSPGDRVVSVKDTYGGTSVIFTEFMPRFHIDVTLCDTTNHTQLEAEVAAGCKVLYLESPTNPTVKVVDLARLATAAHAVGAIVIVDNTFATPINQNPLQLGADLVLHSATKFLGGHADALGGVICGKQELIETNLSLPRNQRGNPASNGGLSVVARYEDTSSANSAAKCQCSSACAILWSYIQLLNVYFILAWHHIRGHAIACQQMRGFGGNP